MLPLILTILCSTSIALILKHSDNQKGEPIVLLAGNYLTASITAFIFIIIYSSTFSVQSFIFGILLGVMFVASFFAFARAVAEAGTALATVASRLSVIIPIIFSIILFDEKPNGYKLIGFLFTAITFVLFYLSLLKKNNQSHNRKKYFLLIFVLIGIGINDFSMKIFKSTMTQSDEPFFVFSVFFSAFIYSILYILYKRIRIDKKTFYTGIILGIPNVFSTIFLLAALSQLPAIFVFPTINVGIIIFTAIGAFILWREKINNYGLYALVTGIIAILFLSINSF